MAALVALRAVAMVRTIALWAWTTLEGRGVEGGEWREGSGGRGEREGSGGRGEREGREGGEGRGRSKRSGRKIIIDNG